VGKGSYVGVTLNTRPHARLELEYRLDNDLIDSREPVEGSKRILTQRAQQVLAIWHFTARDSVRTIFQAAFTRRAPSLWEQPVSARENTDTVSIVYGHRRGLGTNFYFGTTYSRTRNPDAGVKSYQTEIFAKGSWSFDVL